VTNEQAQFVVQWLREQLDTGAVIKKQDGAERCLIAHKDGSIDGCLSIDLNARPPNA
jgi:hypothetical protein